jgi:hypothetical protein
MIFRIMCKSIAVTKVLDGKLQKKDMYTVVCRWHVMKILRKPNKVTLSAAIILNNEPRDNPFLCVSIGIRKWITISE